jgi:hypothetical protein
MAEADRDVRELETRLIDGMIHYMRYGGAEDADDPSYDPEFDPGYTQEHVTRCAEIVDTYLSSLAEVPARSKNPGIIDAVKKAVLDLNALNDTCGGGLIETDQREQLCALIIAAAKRAGLETDGDITEEWREW